MCGLGELACQREHGALGALNLLARAGLPVLEGVVVTCRAHREFLAGSGLGRYLLLKASSGEPPGGEPPRGFASAPLGDALQAAVCDALAALGARSVAVLSEYGGRAGLRTIPAVLDALRRIWLSPEGLKLQLEALSAGAKPPTWPVLLQRELRPELSGWAAVTPRSRRPDLYGVRTTRPPSGGDPGLNELLLGARDVLGEPVRLRWCLTGGEWRILDVLPAGKETHDPRDL
ncbi:hypothetical protein Rxycam_01275 [Rubrobacter xylanophilus DSM 9941]|uniref:PEP/pyruvate-binding domain-containing protein n=1 Tax=Rubrobacter xylanophilus TaxID=49319 RepID=UPI001C63DBA8|nr:PEP/pyruvate-binding domain-containing protein [Rubrobacter xylanophilus]QYJ15452.1 hypothetical protein Rxycam_01275 [Rubrobacter xylanophilus DSM 9941]